MCTAAFYARKFIVAVTQLHMVKCAGLGGTGAHYQTRYVGIVLCVGHLCHPGASPYYSHCIRSDLGHLIRNCNACHCHSIIVHISFPPAFGRILAMRLGLRPVTILLSTCGVVAFRCVAEGSVNPQHEVFLAATLQPDRLRASSLAALNYDCLGVVSNPSTALV